MDDIKAKSTGSPAFFSFPGHARLTSLADFLFLPCFIWEPVRRLGMIDCLPKAPYKNGIWGIQLTEGSTVL